jgi:mannose-6-phosphate isomerase
MNTFLYGGNLVKVLGKGYFAKQMLGSGPYEFFIYQARSGGIVTFNELRSFTVYLLDKQAGVKVTVKGVNEPLMVGDCVQCEDTSAEVSVRGGEAKLLISGTKGVHPEQKGLFFLSHANLYKVDKPWGHELWINGQHPLYALKQIFLKAGNKTSLQYHKLKRETNVLFAGRSKLHFKNNEAVNNESVSSCDIGQVELDPICSIDVSPGILHRLEAITDMLLFETSTPHLDDVVRVSDDTNRTHGRIDKEHASL